jgi:hypothetical protein
LPLVELDFGELSRAVETHFGHYLPLVELEAELVEACRNQRRAAGREKQEAGSKKQEVTIQYPVIQYRASGIQYPASSIQYPASSMSCPNLQTYNGAMIQ